MTATRRSSLSDRREALTRTAARGPAPSADQMRIRGCTCFRVRRLARRFTQIYDRMLAPSGLRVTQFSLLSQLLSNDAMAMGPLATAMDMDRTTLTRNLKPLLEAGLVSIARAASDARQREVRLTPQGRVRCRDAGRLWRRAQDEINRTLGESRIASLHAMFDGLIETLHVDDPVHGPDRSTGKHGRGVATSRKIDP